MKRQIDRAFLTVPLAGALILMVTAGVNATFDNVAIRILVGLFIVCSTSTILGIWTGQGER